MTAVRVGSAHASAGTADPTLTAPRTFLDDLDPGIRPHVVTLRAAGVETFESCQGGEGHACPEPVVMFHGNAREGFRALAIAMDFGLPVLDLRRYWQIVDGEPCGPYWQMSFRPTAACSDRTAGGSPCR